MRQDAVWDGVQTGSREPVWEAVQTASQTGSRNQSGKQSGDCFPDTFPDCFPGAVWEGVWEAVPRQLPRQLPRHLFQEVSGKLSRQLPKQVSRILLQDVPNRSRTLKTPIPGNRWFGRVLGSGRQSGTSIPYSIYISQFQTGTPKPRYIGFRAGGRENGTQNGQFRPVFGHILRPLPEPHFFMKFVLWSMVSQGSWEVAPGRLQDVSRTRSGRVSGKGVWSSFPGAAPDCFPDTQSGGVSGGCLEQLPRKLLQTAPDCHQTEASVWKSATNQTAPGASPCCQVGKSAQVTPTCHGMP